MIRTKRRESIDIEADILRVAHGGALKTRIVYQANLNFEIVKGYLDGLIGRKLLERKVSRYFPTDKAGDYLDAYDTISAFRG